MSNDRSTQSASSDDDDVIEVAIWEDELPCGQRSRRFAIVRQVRNEDGQWVSTNVFDEEDLATLKRAIKGIEGKLAEMSKAALSLLN